MFYSLAKSLALPPTAFFVLFLLGLLIKRWRPRLGRGFLWILLGLVYLSTTPFAAGELMAPLQQYAPVDPESPDPEAGAIVVLGAGIYFAAPEYLQTSAPHAYSDTANALSLQRVEYAAYLARNTQIPILVSGGATGPNPEITVARAMKQTLERDFGVEVRWVEEESDSTMSNAERVAQILQREGVRRFYLVTHAWHMPRAMIAFERTQVVPLPAPTRYVSRAEPRWQDFVPSAKAFLTTYYATHEWLGIAWYRLQSLGD